MLEELVYSAAQRALDQQSTSLSDLRTRTSTLVVADPCRLRFPGWGILSASVPQPTSILASHQELPRHGPCGWVETIESADLHRATRAKTTTTTPSVVGAVLSGPHSR